jgi:hypothetical protein
LQSKTCGKPRILMMDGEGRSYWDVQETRIVDAEAVAEAAETAEEDPV